MRLVISSGHGKYVAGASGYINEVEQARRVVDHLAPVLKQMGHEVVIFHDDTSRDKSTNLRTIVKVHNSQTRDLDVSIHFNDTGTGKTDSPIGTECWYYSQAALAKEVSKQIAVASGLKDRGGKKSTSLYFLAHCNKPAVLAEVAFVNSRTDSDLYNHHFARIVQGLASALVGQESLPLPPSWCPTINAFSLTLEAPPRWWRGHCGSFLTSPSLQTPSILRRS